LSGLSAPKLITGENLMKKNTRKCGEIKGSISEIQPFFYIARRGARSLKKNICI